MVVESDLDPQFSGVLCTDKVGGPGPGGESHPADPCLSGLHLDSV